MTALFPPYHTPLSASNSANLLCATVLGGGIAIKPSIEAIKVESTNIICGSGTDTQSLRMGGNPSDDDDAPASTSGWGYTGIWGE